MNWLKRHAAAIEAAGTILTALVALAALIAIPLQIRANADIQAAQSARDIYREFVALSVNKPDLADPDYCALKQSDSAAFTSYQFYMEYLLYTAEQVTAVSDDWLPVMQSHLADHQAFICGNHDWHSDEGPAAALISAARAKCTAPTSC